MLRICFISTYPPIQCGIAEYTHNLINALIQINPLHAVILTERGGEWIFKEEPTCLPCFSRGTDYVEGLLKPIANTNPDIVHIQHDYSIFGLGDQFLDLLEKIERTIVVTMHEVHTSMTPEKISYGIENLSRNHAKLGKVANKIIVHSETMKKWLCEYGVKPGKIEVIPHGTTISPKISTIKAKRVLGFLESNWVILSLGFIRRSKNESLLIRTLPEILQKIPEARLLLVGSLHPHSSLEDVEEARTRRSITRELQLEQYVRFIERYMGVEELAVVLRGADVLVFLHDKPYVEISGAVHLGIGAGKPIIATAIPRYEEIQRISPETTILPGDKDRLVEILSNLYTNKDLVSDLKRRFRAYASKTSWINIAREHYRIYADILK